MAGPGDDRCLPFTAAQNPRPSPLQSIDQLSGMVTWREDIYELACAEIYPY